MELDFEIINGLIPFQLMGTSDSFEKRYMPFFMERYSEEEARNIVSSIWLFANDQWSKGHSFDNWISIFAKMPPNSDSVLVAFPDGTIDHDWWDKEFHHWARLRHDTSKITHWQPLPPPPQKQSE